MKFKINIFYMTLAIFFMHLKLNSADAEKRRIIIENKSSHTIKIFFIAKKLKHKTSIIEVKEILPNKKISLNAKIEFDLSLEIFANYDSTAPGEEIKIFRESNILDFVNQIKNGDVLEVIDSDTGIILQKVHIKTEKEAAEAKPAAPVAGVPIAKKD